MLKLSNFNRPRIALATTLFAAILASYSSFASASKSKKVEKFQCGSIGIVTLTSLPKLSSDRGQNTYSALLTIKSKKLHIPGVVHSFMGGSDRTFTRNPTDNFRQPEETSDKNPATLHVISGNVYGKNRDMITLFTLNETNTCIRLVQSGGES